MPALVHRSRWPTVADDADTALVRARIQESICGALNSAPFLHYTFERSQGQPGRVCLPSAREPGRCCDVVAYLQLSRQQHGYRLRALEFLVWKCGG